MLFVFINIFTGAINGLVSILLSFFIFIKNPKSIIHRTFSILYFFVGLWSFGWSYTYSLNVFIPDIWSGFSWDRILALSYIPIAILFYHFILAFTGQIKQKEKSLIIGYALNIFYIFVDWFFIHPYFISGETVSWYAGDLANAGIVYCMFMITWLFYAIYGIYLLRIYYKQVTGFKRMQARYLFWGSAIGFGGASTGFFTFFPYVNLVPPLGTALLSACVFGAAIAIIRYRLMDIRFALGKSVVYFLTFATILLAGLGAIYLGDSFLHHWYFIFPFRILVFLLLFIWFPKLSQFFEKIGGKYFYYTAYQARKTFSQLGLELTKILNLEQLNKVVVQSLNQAFQVKHVEFSLLEDIEKTNPSLVRYLVKTVQHVANPQQPLVAEEITGILHQIPEEKDFLLHTQEQMRKDRIELYLPLFFQQKLTGLITLGEKANQEAYAQEEIDLLTQFSYHVAIVLQNTQLYGQLEDLTQNLQKKVDEQTAEVRKAYEVEKKAYEELKKLDVAKDEFILITQHHLRTPLTIMKGFISAILKTKLEPKVVEYVGKISSSTDRLAQIVNEFLDITQFQIGKGLLKIEPTNLYNMVKEIFDELQPEITKKKLSVKMTPDKDWPLIPADSGKLKQALFNIIDNAIKYTKEGGIAVSLKKQENKVLLTIEDTGIGLSPEDLKHLFAEIFERSEEAKKVFPTGRGVGLFVTASIIKAHQGRIWAESEGPGKGTRFCVEMPMGLRVLPK